MVVHYPRTVWKNYAEHKVTGKTYNQNIYIYIYIYIYILTKAEGVYIYKYIYIYIYIYIYTHLGSQFCPYLACWFGQNEGIHENT